MSNRLEKIGSLHFEPLSLDGQSAYLNLLAQTPQKSSDYSFVNLWSWSEEYGLYWAWDADLVWILQTIPEKKLWAPIGNWDTIDWIRRLDPFASSRLPFVRIPDRLFRLWDAALKGRLQSEAARGDWDYLYDADLLARLPGNRYHKKKNLLNQFLKKYPYQYLPLGPERIANALAMQSDWCTWRDCESHDMLAAENRVIEKVLRNWENLKGLLGGALLVDGEMAAYTIAEQLSENMLLIHFEKGNPEYKGIYQAVNALFLQNLALPCKIVNREQDLDDEGLRKAKLSYHPIDFIRKYQVVMT